MKVIELCTSKLGVALESSAIERAHRIGFYKDTNIRPIIVKFSSFKKKQEVLLSKKNLAGSTYGIKEDFSAAVRFQRDKLIHYGKSLNKSFKLRYNKLHVDNRTYVYNARDNEVVEQHR